MAYDVHKKVDLAFVEQAVYPALGGRVRYQGTIWPAYSMDDSVIDVAELATVVDRDGIRLLIKRYNKNNV